MFQGRHPAGRGGVRTKRELLDLALDFFLREEDAPVVEAPADYAGRRRLLRALMNVRPPRPVPPAVLEAQDALLGAEREEKGVVAVMQLPSAAAMFPGTPVPHASALCLWRGDITRLDAGAVVNAANAGMLGCFVPLHACIDNVIHSAAGVQLRLECQAMMLKDYPDGVWAEPAGSARITAAWNLPCARVIHTVGPVVDGPLTDRHRGLLASCYRACLDLAARERCRSLAFCCISTGEFRFPKAEAARIALNTVTAWLEEHPRALERVVFDVFTEEDHAIYCSLF